MDPIYDDVAIITAPGVLQQLHTVGVVPGPSPTPPHCGLTNQGATCYLNSVIQGLFHVTQVRRVALSAPLVEGAGEGGAGANVQLLFARMCLGLKAAQDTTALTRSFGWREDDVFVQHDASELLSVLLDKLASLGGGWADLRAATTGRISDTIECALCGFRRERSDDLCGLALAVPRAPDADVSGIRPTAAGGAAAAPARPAIPLSACLAAHLAPERLEDPWRGCDKCGAGGAPVPATKRLALAAVPDVLPVALKRYAFDASSGRYVKIDDAVSVPPTLNFGGLVTDGGTGAGAAPHALRAVLLHAGATAARGHYVVLLRGPSEAAGGAGSWLLANDSGVTRVTDAEAAAVLEPGAAPDAAPAVSDAPTRPRRSPIPTGATPYLLVYARDLADAAATGAPAPGPALALLPPDAAPPAELTRVLAAAGLSDAALAAQRAHALALGAAALPPAIAARVAAENWEWLRLCAAYRARQRVVRLCIHPSWLPRAASEASEGKSADATPPAPPASVELFLPCALDVRSAVAACLRAVAAAETDGAPRRAPPSPALVRLRLFHPATGAAADTYSRPDLQTQPLAALGWGAAVDVQLEAHATAWGPAAAAAAAAATPREAPAVAWEEFDPRALSVTLLRWSPMLHTAARLAVDPPATPPSEGDLAEAAELGAAALASAASVTLPGAPVPTVATLQAAITASPALSVPLVAQSALLVIPGGVDALAYCGDACRGGSRPSLATTMAGRLPFLLPIVDQTGGSTDAAPPTSLSLSRAGVTAGDAVIVFTPWDSLGPEEGGGDASLQPPSPPPTLSPTAGTLPTPTAASALLLLLRGAASPPLSVSCNVLLPVGVDALPPAAADALRALLCAASAGGDEAAQAPPPPPPAAPAPPLSDAALAAALAAAGDDESAIAALLSGDTPAAPTARRRAAPPPAAALTSEALLARVSVSAAAARDDTLTTLKARLAAAANAQLSEWGVPGRLDPAALHLRRGGRQLRDEAATLALANVGEGAELALGHGVPLNPGEVRLDVAVTGVAQSHGGAAPTARVTLIVDAGLRVRTVRSRILQALRAQAADLLAVPPAPDAPEGSAPTTVSDPAQLRLKVRAGAAASGPILRDEGSLRAALTATRGAADAGDADCEPDERGLVCAVLRAPEVLTSRDMVVRLRGLRLPAERGGAGGAGASTAPTLSAGVDAVLPKQGVPERDLAAALQAHCGVTAADLPRVHIARAPQFGPALTGASAAATLPNGHAIPVPPPPGAARASARAAVAPLPQLSWLPLLPPPSSGPGSSAALSDPPLGLKDGSALLWCVLPDGPGPNLGGAAAGADAAPGGKAGAAGKPWLQRGAGAAPRGGVAGGQDGAEGVSVAEKPALRGGPRRGGGIVIL